jgi:hypothetical protein
MKLAIALIALLAVAACDSSSSSSKSGGASAKKHTGPSAELLDKMQEFRDAVCACKDTACVDKVEQGMMEWAMKNMDKLEKQMKSASKADNDIGERLDDEMDKCKERISASAAAEAPPAATTP